MNKSLTDKIDRLVPELAEGAVALTKDFYTKLEKLGEDSPFQFSPVLLRQWWIQKALCAHALALCDVYGPSQIHELIAMLKSVVEYQAALPSLDSYHEWLAKQSATQEK